MTNSRLRIPGIRWVLAFMAAAMLALSWAPAAIAQQDDQYDGTVAPSGPAAGEPVTVLNDEDGVVGPGDTLIIEGDFVVSEGASVTLEDSDGTQGTLIDGQNAEITEGSIIIQVTDFPVGVVGGDGVLNTDGLFVVATTGIFAAGDDDAGGDADDDGANAGAGAGTGAGASAGDATASAGTGDGAVAQAGTGAGEGATAQADTGADAAAGAGDDAVASEGAAEESAAVAVLPDTGGSITALVLAGGLLLLGAGFVIRRFAGSN